MQQLLSQNMGVTLPGRRFLNDHIHVARSVKAIQLWVNPESNVNLTAALMSIMNWLFTEKFAHMPQIKI